MLVVLFSCPLCVLLSAAAALPKQLGLAIRFQTANFPRLSEEAVMLFPIASYPSLMYLFSMKLTRAWQLVVVS